MRKKKYFYNTGTHRFEKLVVPIRTRLFRLFGFLSASTVTALIIVALAFKFISSPEEIKSRNDIEKMREKYGILQESIEDVDHQLDEMEKRDDDIYRVIFEAEPLPDSVRIGSKTETVSKNYNYLTASEIITQTTSRVAELRHRLAVQNASFDTLEQLVKTKETMLSCIPAIQPVSNKDLSRIASGFGYRIDPIYKTPKLHTGLDFSAPQGTPIYATANGKILSTGFDEGGYGNHVLINHGYGYTTVYGHMVRVKARPGETVKRGEVIGWVGSTGKSTGPHCHYEVIRNGEKIDPVHYFFNDLDAVDYERLVRIAAANNQSFD